MMTTPQLKISERGSQAAEQQERQLQKKGYKFTTLSYDAGKEKIFLGDVRDYVERENELVNVKKLNEARVMGSSGKSIDNIKIFSDLYQGMMEGQQRLTSLMDTTNYTYQGLLAAAGTEMVTDYETIKKTGELIMQVTGQSRLMDNYLAINAAETRSFSDLRIEYVRKTSVPFKVQVGLADDQSPTNVRQSYAVESKMIFADGVSFEISNRDVLQNKANIMEEFRGDLPGAFLEAKNTKAIAALQTIAGTNQGDWDAFTSATVQYEVDAAAQVETAEDAVRKYGGQLVAVMPRDSWRMYANNTGMKNYAEEKPGNMSTIGHKMGHLGKNPGVMYYLDDGMAASTYALVAKQSFMKLLQGSVVQSETDTKGTPGQIRTRFYFDFNDIVVTEPSAGFRGTTLGTA